MLISVLAIFVCALLLVFALGWAGVLHHKMFSGMILGGYVVRFFVALFLIRDVQFFSHAVGGDSYGYENLARLLAYMWQRTGIHFISQDEFPDIGPTSLPPNLFALLAWFDEGPTLRFGCTAIVALAAGLTTLNLYMLSLQFGATRHRALLFSAILYLQPSLLFYTSDMYKDGLVVALVIGALASAIRLANKFSVRDAIIGVVSVVALWYVRYYLIFVTVAPLVVGVLGLRKNSLGRALLVAVVLGVGLVAVGTYTDLLQFASERATRTFETGTSLAVMEQNSEGGSGVMFEDGGSPSGQLALKVAYTLFSPFLWKGGSIGFHIGKLDVVLWYFVIYCAIRASFKADRRIVIMIATFVVPCTIVYAMGMSNVGLIVRQRLPIVAAVTVLAALYEPKRVVARDRGVARARALRKLRAA